MNFGFLVRCDQRGTTFSEVGTSGPAASQLLSVTSENDFQAVFLGRLYYLDDLRRRLAAEHRPEAAATPAEYVRAVYEQAGAEGLSWLEGDYSFVLWDARERRSIAARDPMGGFPLFWVRVGDEIAISNAMRPLLDLVPQRRLDLDYLAEFLVLPFGGAQELHTERCAYTGVHRVLAGTRLEMSPGGSPKSIRWWDWLAQMKEPESLEPAEIAARYGDLLDAAVAQRRVGRTAAHLSGGMDSTAVALLAARQAHAAGEEPVHGLALIYERQNVLSRERPYVESVDGTPDLQLHRLPGEECLDFDAYDYAIDPDEPVLSLYQSAMCHALLKRAAEIGARTLMTGFGADELVGLQPFPLYDHLRTGRWFTAWREASALAATRSDSSWRYLSRYGFRFFLPAGLRGGLGCWLSGGRVAWEKQQAHTIGPWVRPEFARRHGLWQHRSNTCTANRPAAVRWLCRRRSIRSNLASETPSAGKSVRRPVCTLCSRFLIRA